MEGIELTERTPESKAAYWMEAWQKAKDREKALADKSAMSDAAVTALRADLEAMKAERDRWRREASNLKKKLAAIEDGAIELVDDEEYEPDEDGRNRPENDFDQRDHYREM